MLVDDLDPRWAGLGLAAILSDQGICTYPTTCYVPARDSAPPLFTTHIISVTDLINQSVSLSPFLLPYPYLSDRFVSQSDPFDIFSDQRSKDQTSFPSVAPFHVPPDLHTLLHALSFSIYSHSSSCGDILPPPNSQPAVTSPPRAHLQGSRSDKPAYARSEHRYCRARHFSSAPIPFSRRHSKDTQIYTRL